MIIDPSFSRVVQEARITNQFCFEVLPETERFGQTDDKLCGLTDISEPNKFSLPSVLARKALAGSGKATPVQSTHGEARTLGKGTPELSIEDWGTGTTVLDFPNTAHSSVVCTSFFVVRSFEQFDPSWFQRSFQRTKCQHLCVLVWFRLVPKWIFQPGVFPLESWKFRGWDPPWSQYMWD